MLIADKLCASDTKAIVVGMSRTLLLPLQLKTQYELLVNWHMRRSNRLHPHTFILDTC